MYVPGREGNDDAEVRVKGKSSKVCGTNVHVNYQRIVILQVTLDNDKFAFCLNNKFSDNF